jgi:lysophospholipase L1-like esterase
VAAQVLRPGTAARLFSEDGQLDADTLAPLATLRACAWAGAALRALAGAVLVARRVAAEAWFARHATGLLRIALVLATLGLCVAILEVVLRLREAATGPVLRDCDDARIAREFMARVRPQLNADGLRDDPIDRPRAAGQRRLLLLGDSFAFGFGIDERERTLAAVLSARLASSGGLDVFNAGIPGADTRRQLQALRALAPRVGPDAVLLLWYVNDAESEADKRRYFAQRRLAPLLSDVLLRHSALWRRLEPALVERLVEGGWRTDYVGHLRRLHGLDGGDAWVQRAEFLELLAEAGADGRSVLVALMPMLADLEAYPLRDVHAVVRGACAGQGVPCLDLLDVFAGRDAASLWVSACDHHLDAQGAALAGEAIAAFVERTLRPAAPPAR